uniref:Adaptin ear-binding coat-associated protein 1 n=1 Tax=Equus caballus TaxID=9796 RepID=A0A3Q2I2F3_HORSE
MAAELEYESVLCVKPDVSVYRIPPRASNRGYRASDWKLDQPDWTGRLRITSKGKIAYIKLEDKVSGELFAQAPVEQYPGIAVETVTDSSRYFVIRIQDGTGRSAFIGIGFTDRGDAFDFNVSLQDHFKWVKQESEISKECQEMDTRPKLDLGFKEGQTITLSIGNITTKKGGASKPKTAGAGGLSLLPPPPGGKVTIPPPSSSVAISNHVTPPPIPKSNHGGSDAGPSFKTEQVWSCCPKSWISFRSHCYFVSANNRNWSESEKRCSEMNAHLLVITTKEEEDFITQKLPVKNVYYIGLSDPKGKRQWQWVDQAPYNKSITFWHPGEPSNPSERCVILNYASKQWGWNDVYCHGAQTSVCKMTKIYI